MRRLGFTQASRALAALATSLAPTTCQPAVTSRLLLDNQLSLDHIVWGHFRGWAGCRGSRALRSPSYSTGAQPPLGRLQQFRLAQTGMKTLLQQLLQVSNIEVVAYVV